MGTEVPVAAVDPGEPKAAGGAVWFHQARSLRLTGAPGGLRTSCSVVHCVPYLLPDWQYVSPPQPAAAKRAMQRSERRRTIDRRLTTAPDDVP